MATQSPDNEKSGTRRLDETKLDRRSIEHIQDEIRQVYLADSRPWVIGYSGGKDSTTTLQLTWYALAKLPAAQRKKPVFVIASDTLVETPVVVGYIDKTLEKIEAAARQQGMPFSAHKVKPKSGDTFWVNMIGKGYPAPYRRFRWCTDRLKIAPANAFIEERVHQFSEVVLVLGVRRAESATRAQVLTLHRKPGELLSRHTVIKSAWVYAPIEMFETEDVWAYLLSSPSPWGSNNRDLVTMYRNAQAGECPLVVDKTTPSCGNSRFGCWVCTVVERDKSMEAMIDSGQDWMEPMLEVRDWLASTQDPSKKQQFRRLRRRNGRIQMWGDNDEKIVWGPYLMEVRMEILRRVLRAQKLVRTNGPDPRAHLISPDELHEIRRIWRTEEGDWEDSLPGIYRAEIGDDIEWIDDDDAGTTVVDQQTLEGVCVEHDLPTDMVKELIDIERRLQGLGRRSSVFDDIKTVLRKDWRTAEEVFLGMPKGDDNSNGETDPQAKEDSSAA